MGLDLALANHPGEALPLKVIAEYCQCTVSNIQQMETAAMKRLRQIAPPELKDLIDWHER